MDHVVAAKLVDSTTPSLGSFALLPRELRDQIYKLLLSCPDLGTEDDFNLGILRTSSAIYSEAIGHLYDAVTVLAVHCLKFPADALRRIKHLTLDFRYCTFNRGDCEVSICDFEELLRESDYKALALRRSEHLQSLSIWLTSMTMWERGSPKPGRSRNVMAGIARLLRPYAALPKNVKVEIMGFAALDFAEEFGAVREGLAGTDMPVEYLCDLD